MTKAISTTVAATMEPALSRRQMLTGMAAASASVAVVATPSPAKSAMASALPVENPDLLQAHAELLAAHAEHEEAKAALEWLADEWKHLWPLAPEELLEGAHAQSPYGNQKNAERDIIGRLLLRDTTGLTKRLNAKQRAELGKTCFHLLTAERAREIIAEWESPMPVGRTEKARARNQAFRAERIRRYQERLIIAEAYEEETARLRAASGVDAVKDRISKADAKADRATSKISRTPAFTPAGLAIKGEVLAANPVFASAIGDLGFFGEVARFVQSVLDMGGRA